MRNITAPQIAERSRTKDLIEVINHFKPHLEEFETIYKDIHHNAELSRQESRTARIAARHLKSLKDYEVHENIGGYGVVGVLRNGAGPTVLLRADMDALPVVEETGLPYASTRTGVDPDGKSVGIMHACGHDMHTSTLMPVSTTLAKAKAHWSGTLIILFQPSEELGSGAQAMIDDGLYGEKYGIPEPDIVLAQHVLNIKSGTVEITGGPALAAIDGFTIRIFGKGGSGTRPDLAIDPVLAAAHIVVKLHTMMTREVQPGEMAVLTCGSIQAGHAANVIPPFADIKLTLRAYNEEVHDRIVLALHRVVQAECDAAGCEKKPEINNFIHLPATINDEAAANTLMTAFRERFGDSCSKMDPNPASEDFSNLARAVNKPYLIWIFGVVDPEEWDKAAAEGTLSQFPYPHSPFFAPKIQPPMSTGVDAMSLAALIFLGDR